MSMRVKFIPLIVALAAVALALTMVSSGQAGPSDIFGSAHDTGTAGNPTCAQCHIPHQAQGDYLWARTPGTTTVGGDTGPLCLSCHDGTVAQEEYIFAPGTINHPMGAVTHMPIDHDASKGCMSCHDAHDPDFKFTWDQMRFGATRPANPDNANVCLACHNVTPGASHSLAPSHPFDVEDPGDLSWRTLVPEPDIPTSVVLMPSTMTPNLPTDQTFKPDLADTAGTRLWDLTNRKTPVGAGESGKIGCLSCHSAHGAVGSPSTEVYDNPLNTMLDVDPDSSHEPICENCHK